MPTASALRRLSRNRPLSMLIAAGALSAFGDWLYLAALPIIVYQATHDAALVGLAAAGRLLPFFVLSMPAGLVVDRFDRRLVMIVAESTRCLLMLVMAGAYVLHAGVVVLIVVATAAAAAGTFAIPAQNALVPQLIRDGDELGLANACSSVLANLACVLGPVVASLLVITSGLGLACAINGLSFAAVVVILLLTRPAPSAASATSDPTETAPTSDGPAISVGAIARLAAGPITLDAAISFAAGALGVLPVLIAVDGLHLGDAFAGVLGAGSGLGAVAGGLAAGALANGRAGRGTGLGIVSAAVAIGVLGTTTIAIVAVAAGAFAFGALVMLDTLNLTAVQRSLPEAALGRAFGILHTSAAIWLMAGSSIPPIVAGMAGVGPAVLVTGGVVAVFGIASLVVRIAGDTNAPNPTHTEPATRHSPALIAEGPVVEPATA